MRVGPEHGLWLWLWPRHASPWNSRHRPFPGLLSLCIPWPLAPGPSLSLSPRQELIPAQLCAQDWDCPVSETQFQQVGARLGVGFLSPP